jgi:hypothetical protein
MLLHGGISVGIANRDFLRETKSRIAENFSFEVSYWLCWKTVANIHGKQLIFGKSCIDNVDKVNNHSGRLKENLKNGAERAIRT